MHPHPLHSHLYFEKDASSLTNINCIYCRFLSIFSDNFRSVESDDIHAALALMYGYAAKYAPSTVIEARINALIVWLLVP